MIGQDYEQYSNLLNSCHRNPDEDLKMIIPLNYIKQTHLFSNSSQCSRGAPKQILHTEEGILMHIVSSQASIMHL